MNSEMYEGSSQYLTANQSMNSDMIYPASFAAPDQQTDDGDLEDSIEISTKMIKINPG